MAIRQALDGTWEEYQKDQRRRGARRDNIRDATDFIGWYMNDSTRMLGISKIRRRKPVSGLSRGPQRFCQGSYKAKGWLVTIAQQVGARAESTASQLARCGR